MAKWNHSPSFCCIVSPCNQVCFVPQHLLCSIFALYMIFKYAILIHYYIFQVTLLVWLHQTQWNDSHIFIALSFCLLILSDEVNFLQACLVFLGFGTVESHQPRPPVCCLQDIRSWLQQSFRTQCRCCAVDVANNSWSIVYQKLL